MTFKLKVQRKYDLYLPGDYFVQVVYENGHSEGEVYKVRRINQEYTVLWKQAIFSFHSPSGTDEKHIRKATSDEIFYYNTTRKQTESYFDTEK